MGTVPIKDDVSNIFNVGSVPRTDRLRNGPYILLVRIDNVGFVPRTDRLRNGPCILLVHLRDVGSAPRMDRTESLKSAFTEWRY